MRYNLARFNLARIGKEIPSSMYAQEIVECAAGGKLLIYATLSANENVDGRATMHAVLPGTSHASEEVLGEFTLRKLVHGQLAVSEAVNAAAEAAKNLFVLGDAEEEIFCEAVAGKFIPIIGDDTADDVLGNFHLGKIIPVAMHVSEIVECDTEATLTQHIIAEINVDIPPGGEIRINSDIFTALMGLENILWAYSGGWINLTRDSVSLVVDSGTGGELTGEIIYNERFV